MTAEAPMEIQALPLSLAQRPLWFMQRLDPSGSAYNVPLSMTLVGALDADRLRRALETVVERHEALRTTLETVDGEPVQVFHPSIEVPWEAIDLAELPEDERRRAIAAIEDEEATRPFDLVRGPLLRSRLARLADDEHVWFLTLHHVVFDGWSQEVLLDELGRLYDPGAEAPPELPIQYADFAAWQEEELSGERLERLVGFWRRELDGYPTVLRLPTDFPRPARQSFRGAAVTATLPAGAWRRAEALAGEEGATPFMVFLAVWMTVLHRLSGADRLVVGTPSSGRSHPDAEGLIGNFVNTLPVGADLSGDPTFRELLGRVRERTVAAVAHEELMFEQIVEAVEPERHPSLVPLAQVAMAVERFNLEARELAPGLAVEARPAAVRTSKVDLTLFVRPARAGVRLVLEHATDLFVRETAERWLAYVGRLAEGALADPDRPLSELPLMAEEERRLLLEAWPLPLDPADAPRPAAAAARWETGLPAAFAERAAETPDAVAVEGLGGPVLTYGGLDRRSVALAARLAAAGVRRGMPVALVLDRSPELVVALLAVLRAGGVYVPLDRSYPEERRRLMVEDAGARLLLTTEALADGLGDLGGVEVLRIGGAEDAAPAGGTAPAAAAGPDDPAYVIYTSGSTGTPKGVVVSHRGVARLALGADFTTLGPDETFLHLASISFDAATLEVWGPLLTGGRVALFPAETPSPAAVRAALARHRATRSFLTTALFNQLAEEPEAIPDCLLHLMTGGEQASPAAFRAVRAARPDLALSNLYGPTENATLSTHGPLPGAEDGPGSTPDAIEQPTIGRAVAGSTCWVLDRALRPVPTGVEGELLVGGDGLAHGYLGRPALTAERFVPHPFAARPGERLYRTGDLVRWLPGGDLDFRGRNDFQVKIRGFRIEPGEVEKALGETPGVEKALVVVRPVAGEPALVGYYVPRSGDRSGDGAQPDAVREHLRRRLPPFMVPAALVAMEAFPINAQGKVDRAALPEPERSSEAAGGAEFVAPRTPLEEEIAALWAEVMDLERVGIHDDFFALGGHSLLATRILARLADDFGVEVPLADLFEAPTVAGLATALGTAMLDDMEDLEEIEDVS